MKISFKRYFLDVLIMYKYCRRIFSGTLYIVENNCPRSFSRMLFLLPSTKKAHANAHRRKSELFMSRFKTKQNLMLWKGKTFLTSIRHPMARFAKHFP